eukprot:4835569-Amphidinium_carterae.1
MVRPKCFHSAASSLLTVGIRPWRFKLAWRSGSTVANVGISDMASRMTQKKEAVAKALQTKREKKAASQKAQAMVDGGEAAVDQTIVGIANKVASMLVKTPSLCLKVHAMIEEGTLESMLIGSTEQVPDAPVTRRFRQSCTRFSKLPDYVME